MGDFYPFPVEVAFIDKGFYPFTGSAAALPKTTLFSQAATGQPAAADATAYTLGIEFAVSRPVTLDAIWFSSPASAVVLPQTIALFITPAGTLVHSEAASWSGAAASGWVKASFASPPALSSGVKYVAAVLQNTAANWYSGTSAYWTTGAGSGGITNSPLSAPNSANAATNQDQFHVGATLTFPTSGNGSNYWIDPEVTG